MVGMSVLAVSNTGSCKIREFGSSPHRLLHRAAWSSSQHGSRVLRVNVPTDRKKLQVSGDLGMEMSLLPYSISHAITNPLRFKGRGHRCDLSKTAV